MDCARIGPSIRITGDISSEEPLLIDGTIVGSIKMTGQSITVSESGTIEADVVAHTITVKGNVVGSLNATERIVVQQSARIDGDISSPSLTVQDGATIHGKLEIQGRRQPLALAS
jgi:cytoskeletal protein CcmA (bactofilin family)